jgi:hypothetical protein
MNDAHIESVLILGEAFRTDMKFNFGEQRTTARFPFPDYYLSFYSDGANIHV